MVVSSISIADDEITAGLEALRSKHGPISKHGRGGAAAAARPGSGKVSALRKAASTAALMGAQTAPAMPSASELKKAAVDSVQAGLIASLDRDCRGYRAQIKSLQQQIATITEQSEQEKSSAMHQAYESQLQALQEQLDASHREREALLATVSRLTRETKSTPQEQLATAEAALAQTRAECVHLRAQLEEGAKALEAARRQTAEADVAAQKHADRCAKLEADLAEARGASARQAEVEAAVRAELAAAHGATEAAKLEALAAAEEAHKAHAQLEKANLEAVEAKGESSSLARKLAGMAERRDELEKHRKGAEESERKRAAEKALREAAEARKEASGLKTDLSATKAEATRANELVRTLRAKLVDATNTLRPELDSREVELAKGKKALEKQRERADKAEKLNGEVQAELLRLRASLEEARADADSLRALAESSRLSAPAVRDAPKESLAPMGGSADGHTAFGKYQKRVGELEAECAALRSQIAQMAPSPKVVGAVKGPPMRSGR